MPGNGSMAASWRARRLASAAREGHADGAEILVDATMRDYALVREELWNLRRLANTIVMGVIAAVAVGFSAIAALQAKPDPAILSTILLGVGLTLEFVTVVLIGIDSSFKVVEHLSLMQAEYIKDLLRSATTLSIGDAFLGLQPMAKTINEQAPRSIWLASYGAWAFVRMIVPSLAIAAVAAGVMAGTAAPAWTDAMRLLLGIDLIVAAVATTLWALGLRIPSALTTKGVPGGQRRTSPSGSSELRR
jgi:hypothetical protein